MYIRLYPKPLLVNNTIQRVSQQYRCPFRRLYTAISSILSKFLPTAPHNYVYTSANHRGPLYRTLYSLLSTLGSAAAAAQLVRPSVGLCHSGLVLFGQWKLTTTPPLRGLTPPLRVALSIYRACICVGVYSHCVMSSPSRFPIEALVNSKRLAEDLCTSSSLRNARVHSLCVSVSMRALDGNLDGKKKVARGGVKRCRVFMCGCERLAGCADIYTDNEPSVEGWTS